MSTRYLVHCPMCEETFEDEVLFKHLREHHDLDFTLTEVPAETAELVMAFENEAVLAPLHDRAADLERIARLIDAERWPWLRWYHRWELQKLWREHQALLDAQIAFMIEQERAAEEPRA